MTPRSRSRGGSIKSTGAAIGLGQDHPHQVPGGFDNGIGHVRGYPGAKRVLAQGVSRRGACPGAGCDQVRGVSRCVQINEQSA